ncbi:coiled-coil domain-containing protein [Maricaulis maris]|uniref:Bacteriophage tail tape measure C-terminal domain-containing protein n=1 Tax=Maricaulis maris TaxID=74318 RepID=A0A495D1M9_9PROT|nr:hypothetical protein [Maricaulis maris]RKQ95417.1 hypothetical protein C7435_2519 [Maricaulis maris]
MADRKAGSVIIKLDLRGQEEMKRRLEELGPAGERMWRDMSRGAQSTKQGFKAFDNARKEVQSGIDDLASRAGPLGSFLTSIGPWGLAAAAGLGAVALAATQVFRLMERAGETAEFAERLANVERSSGLAASRVLSLSSAVEIAGGTVDGTLNSLEEFSKRLGEFRATGQGEARDGLAALGLVDLADSGADANVVLDAVIERLQEIEDPSRRLAISDKLGLREAGPLLQRTGDEMARILSTADQINAAFSDATITRMAEGAMRIREAEARREAAQRLQSVGFLELEVSLTEARADLDERIAAALNLMVDERDRETAALEEQRDLMVDIAQWMSIIPGLQQASLREATRLNEVLRERAMYDRAVSSEDAAVAYQAMLADWERDGQSGGDDGPDLERRRELEALVEAQLRAMQTPLERLAELETELNEAREAGLDITQAQIDAILEHQRGVLGLIEPIKQLTEDEIKLAGAMAAAADPMEAQKALLEELRAPATQAAERLDRLFALWRTSPDDADIIIAEIERVKEALHGEDGSGVVEMDDRFPTLRKMAEEYANLNDVIDRGGSEMLDGIGDGLTDIVTGAGSVGDAFEDMGNRILRTLAEIATQRFIIGPLAGAFDSFLDGAFGASQGTSSGGSGLPLPKNDTGGHYTVRGNAGIDRNVLSINGNPFAQVSRGEDVAVVPALSAMGGGRGGSVQQLALPPLQILLEDKRTEGGKASVSERRSSDGGRQLRILLEEQVGDLIGAGAFDDQFGRYGLSPHPGRR